MEKYITNSPLQTRKIGEKIAKEILKKDSPGILGLEGELGGGKTTFLQGFARGLGIRAKILSPTFVILKKFKVQGPKFERFYHIDCYRIKDKKEILDLGFKKIISDSQNIVAIEWSNRIRDILPPNTSLITFGVIDKNKRIITIKSLH